MVNKGLKLLLLNLFYVVVLIGLFNWLEQVPDTLNVKQQGHYTVLNKHIDLASGEYVVLYGTDTGHRLNVVESVLQYDQLFIGQRFNVKCDLIKSGLVHYSFNTPECYTYFKIQGGASLNQPYIFTLATITLLLMFYGLITLKLVSKPKSIFD